MPATGHEAIRTFPIFSQRISKIFKLFNDMSTLTASGTRYEKQTDFLPLQGTDYVEFYVGNAKQAAYYYKSAFGFQSLAYAGPENGLKDKTSYAVRQNKLTLVFTT